MSNRERAYERMARRSVKEVIVPIQNRAAQAFSLNSQEAILGNDEDLPILQSNENEYRTALIQNRLILTILKMGRAWCFLSNEDLSSLWLEIMAKKDVIKDGNGISTREIKEIIEKKSTIGDKRIRLMTVQFDGLRKIKTFYKDEYDGIIEQMLKENPHLSVVDFVSEEVRSQEETYGLLRLQIDYLRKEKEKKEREKKERLKSSDRQLVLQQSDFAKPEGNIESSIPTSVSQEETADPDRKPFKLVGWRVFWTDVHFNDNPNQLTELPTDSRRSFVGKLEEINSGRKCFQIKTTSVASCIEMWGIPEYRQKALAARFKWGPGYVQNWAKLVRGPVRVMVNSSEETKKLIFFAANRSSVYRNVFAGMSS